MVVWLKTETLIVEMLTNEEALRSYGGEGIKNVNRFSSESIAKKWQEQLLFVF